MLLKNLIAKNKITDSLFRNFNKEILGREVKGISCNSKDIKKGYILVAIKGENFDGAKFIKEAGRMVRF